MNEGLDVVERLRRAHDDAPLTDLSTESLVAGGRRRRRTRAVAQAAGGALTCVLVAALVVVAPWSSRTTEVADAPATQAWDPVHLQGWWRVTGMAGEDSDTWLGLGVGAPSSLALLQDCGTAAGEWEATATHVLLELDSFGMDDCEMVRPDWMTATARYAAVPEGWELLDEGGARVALLVRDRLPSDPAPEFPTIDPVDPISWQPVPPVEDRRGEAPPVTLPEGWRAATTGDLVGTWRPQEPQTIGERSVTTNESGDFKFYDGCNSNFGRWAVDGEGRLMRMAGLSTAAGCAVPTPTWFDDTAVLAVHDGMLVALDSSGEEIVRLSRS